MTTQRRTRVRRMAGPILLLLLLTPFAVPPGPAAGAAARLAAAPAPLGPAVPVPRTAAPAPLAAAVPVPRTAAPAPLAAAVAVPLAAAAAEPEPATRYRWPLAGEPAVTRPFDPPARRWLPGHRGVDLASRPGEVVRAAGAGMVFFAGPVAGQGVVSIDHPGGLRTTYQPVEPIRSAGDPVAAGDPIGVLLAGHAGCPVEACLHWGLRRGVIYLDPLTLLGLGRVRLLPLPRSSR